MYTEIIDVKKIEIDLKNYTQDFMELFDEDMSTELLSAENKNLQKVNPEPPILPNNQAEYFHSIVANIL